MWIGQQPKLLAVMMQCNFSHLTCSWLFLLFIEVGVDQRSMLGELLQMKVNEGCETGILK